MTMMQDLDIKNYKLLQEISAGGVVILKKEGELMVVTIKRAKMKDHSLPKGHQAPGESLQETAIREVEEETGYKTEAVAYLGPFTYNVKSDTTKTITMRTVHWFLMRATSGSKRSANEEIKKVTLTPINGDFSYLTYDNDKMFIEKTREFLNRHPASLNEG